MDLSSKTGAAPPKHGLRIEIVAALLTAFLITLPLLVVPGNDNVATLPQTLWLQVAAPFLLAARLHNQTPSAPLRLPQGFGAGIAFLAWGALSIRWATDTFAAKQVLFLWIAAAGLSLLIANTVESAASGRRLLLALFWASVAVSGIGLLQHLGGWGGIPQAFPPAATMGNKNVAAGFIAVMAPVGALAFSAAGAAAPAIAMSLGLALAYVLQTGCRAAALAIIVQAGVALWLIPLRDLGRGWGRAKWGALLAGLSVFLGLGSMAPAVSSQVQIGASEMLLGTARPVLRLLGRSGPAEGTESLEGRSPLERADRSVSIRLGVWRNTLEMIRAHPLSGVGIGNFAVHYPEFSGFVPDGTAIDQRVENAHNDYLQLVAEAGLLGAGLLAWSFLCMARGIQAARRDDANGDRGLSLASALGLLGLLVLAGASRTVDQPVSLAAAATFLGVSLRQDARAQATDAASSQHTRAKARYGRSLGLFGASAALVVASSWGVAQIRADRHVLTMAYAEAREDWEAVVQEGLNARRESPRRTDPRFGTASAMLRLGRTAEAAQLLEELTEVDPYNANAVGNLGIAYAALGNSEQAAACFERVLRLRPRDEFARAELTRIKMASEAADSPS